MRRKIYDKLLEWNNLAQGSSAMLVEGARRIGKSYIVEEFARHNISPIEVKSSTRYTLTSINKYIKKYGNYLGTPYVLHSSDLRIENEFVFLPLYMTPFL